MRPSAYDGTGLKALRHAVKARTMA